MEHNEQNVLSFWTVFLLFYLPNNTENQSFEKMKKMAGHILILDICTINENHIVYGSEICSVRDITFCHLAPFFALLPL